MAQILIVNRPADVSTSDPAYFRARENMFGISATLTKRGNRLQKTCSYITRDSQNGQPGDKMFHWVAHFDRRSVRYHCKTIAKISNWKHTRFYDYEMGTLRKNEIERVGNLNGSRSCLVLESRYFRAYMWKVLFPCTYLSDSINRPKWFMFYWILNLSETDNDVLKI